MALIPISELEGLSPLFRGKTGNALARLVLHLSEVDKVEQKYARVECMRGAEGAAAFLHEVGTGYEVKGREHLDELPPGPFITVSNHPIGSLDGVILIAFMAGLRADFKVMANKVLSRVRMLEDNFISVTPTRESRTAPTAESIRGMHDALRHIRGGHPLGLFPSGAVSDLIPGRRPVVTMPDGTSYTEPRIRDREWQMPVIKFISKARVPVVPIRFFDGNSKSFYTIGTLFGWKVRMLRFPHEVLNKQGQTIRLGIGPIITPAMQDCCSTFESLRTLLRGSVYGQSLCP